VLAVVLGAVAGDVLVKIPKPAPALAVEKPAVAKPAGGQSAATRPALSTAADQPAPPPAAESGGAALFIQENQLRAQWYGYVLGPLLVLIAVAMVVRLRRRDVITDDSDTFKEALQIWSGVIQQRRNTPRAVKRYLNRSRYLAVRLRQDEVVNALAVQQGWDAFDKTAPEQTLDLDRLDEQTLVALSAIHHVDPDLLTGDLTAADSLSKVVRAAIAAHRRTFQQWPPSAEQIEHFRQMAAGIKT
jgi:hypothetical protein